VKVAFSLPLRTVSETNAREHWAARAKRAKEQRGIACSFTAFAFEHWGNIPLTITLTRIGPRKLDSDNLAASLKHVRDGIADALGMDDGDERLTWAYAQEKGKEYSVRVRIENTVDK